MRGGIKKQVMTRKDLQRLRVNKLPDLLRACVRVCVYDIKRKFNKVRGLRTSCCYSDVTQGRWRLLNNLVTCWINANHFPTDYANSGSFQAEANAIFCWCACVCVCVPAKTRHITHIFYSNVGSATDKELASGGGAVYLNISDSFFRVGASLPMHCMSYKKICSLKRWLQICLYQLLWLNRIQWGSMNLSVQCLEHLGN